MLITFVNKTKGTMLFPREIGVTDDLKLLRVAAMENYSMQVYAPNAWCQFEEVKFRTAYNKNDRLVIVTALKKRKEFKKADLEEPTLEVDVRWNVEEKAGNAPSTNYSYQINDIQKINIMLNIPIICSIPKSSFCAPYRKLVLACEVEDFSFGDTFTDDRVKNVFHLSLEGRRSDAEMRKIGLIFTADKKTFEA